MKYAVLETNQSPWPPSLLLQMNKQWRTTNEQWWTTNNHATIIPFIAHRSQRGVRSMGWTKYATPLSCSDTKW